MEHIQPTAMDIPPVPLSPAVRAGEWLYVSGQVATRADGSVVTGDFEAEVLQTFDNVETILEAAGFSLGDVVKVNAYLANSMHFPEFNRIYAERVGRPFPARTTLVVAFGHPDVRLEIEAIAHQAPPTVL